MAAMVGVFLFFIFDFYAFCFVLWLLMFLGATMVPTCYGIIIASVDKDLQSLSSSVGQVAFNLMGFFLAPNVSGYIMDQYQNPKQGLIWGYRLILGWNIFTLICITLATCFSLRAYQEKYCPPENVMIELAAEKKRKRGQRQN